MAKRKEHIENLYASLAQQPRRLTPTERRRVMVYLDELGELSTKSNYELARMFQVSEKQIRGDKKRMLQSLSNELTPDNAMMLVAKHTADLDGLIANGYMGLQEADPGSLYHRNYLETLGKLLAQRFTTLQEIGLVRKELGQMTVTHEEWVATVSADMISSVGPAPNKDTDPQP